MMYEIWEHYSSENLKKSIELLEKEPDIEERFCFFHSALRDMLDLIPYDKEDFFSGKHLPFFECDDEIQSAHSLALRGYYRVAFSTLRNVLELTLLIIYYDLNDNASEEITNWANSKEDTPFLRDLVKKIFSHGHYAGFQDLKTEVQNLFWELSNYNHTKGIKYSNRKLGAPSSGALTYNEKTLRNFLETEKMVIRLSLIMTAIKYPIALLEVPLFKKYGFDRPMGYFLDSDQSKRWKEIIGEPIISRLISFANQNKKAIEMQNHVLALPDITDSEIEDQYFNMHKDTIKVRGFLSWEKDFGKIFFVALKDDTPEIISKKEARRIRYESWAKEHQCYDKGLSHEELFKMQQEEIKGKIKKNPPN